MYIHCAYTANGKNTNRTTPFFPIGIDSQYEVFGQATRKSFMTHRNKNCRIKKKLLESLNSIMCFAYQGAGLGLLFYAILTVFSFDI